MAWTGVSMAQEDMMDEPPAEEEEPMPPEDLGPAIAVLDTGTNANVNVVGGFNFLNGNSDLSDQSDNGHGTAVSRIVNEAAPGIPQFQFVVSIDSISASNAALLAAAANPDVRTIAYSSGVISAPASALVEASSAGKFIAIRTGNDGRDNPDVAAVAAHQLPGVVIVTGTNGGGGFLPSSNACGVTAERCVGVSGTTQFSPLRGTSFASARLAAIGAEVLRATPFLSNEDLAQVIFATAIDTGDERLGNGFIANADQVINNPAGPVRMGDGGSGSGVAVAAAGLGAAVGAALLFGDNEEKLEKTLVLDSFGRPFHIDMTELGHIVDTRGSIANFFDSLEQRHDNARVQIGDHHELQAAYVTSDLGVVDPAKYFAFDDDPALGDENVNWVLSFTGEHPDGIHYQLDRHRDPSLNFGVMDTVYSDSTGGRSHFLSGQSFTLPFLGFSSIADSASFGFGGREGFGFDFGVVHTDEDRDHGRDSVAAVAEGSYSFRDRAKISIQLGQLQEDGNLFGGASNGTFSVDGTDTLAASISGSLRIAGRTHLIGNYGVARSEVDEAEIGMLKNFSSVSSDWFGVGLVSDEVLHKGDQFGIAFSRPLRVSEGEVDMHVPYARDFDGNIFRHTDRISLEPGGQEYTLESYYLHPVGRAATLGAYLMLRHEPYHVEDSGADLTVLASYRARF